MGHYPDVMPGQKVRFSAQRETEINHLLNAAAGFSAGKSKPRTSPNVRVQVYNSTQDQLGAGQAVQINIAGAMSGEAFPVVKITDTANPIGVLQTGLASNQIGDLIVSGQAYVQIQGSTGSFAKPLTNGKFQRGDEGYRILHVGSTDAIILLGDYQYAAGSNVSIDGTTISVTGGTGGSAGVEKIIAGTENVDVSPSSGTGVVTISVTGGTGGGGSGFFPVWGHNGHTAVLAPTADEGGNAYYTPERDGYLFACAYFDPFADGFRHTRYDAHVTVNGGKMKVAELRLGSGSNLFVKDSSNVQYTRNTDNDYSGRIRVEVDVYDEETQQYVRKEYTRSPRDDYENPDYDATNNPNVPQYLYYAWSEANYYSLDPEIVYTTEWHLTPESLSEDDDVYTKDDSGEEPTFDYYGSCTLIPYYTYFAWKNGNTIVYTDTGDVVGGDIDHGTTIYAPDNHGVFGSSSYVSSTNTADISAVGAGSGLCIPFSAGSRIYFVVRADGGNYFIRYGIPSCFCVIYEKPAPTPAQEESEEEETE